MVGMGKAGDALKNVLDAYGITQYALAKQMGIERNSLYRWVHSVRDPTADRVVEMVRALKAINPEAARAFVRLYLGEEVDD